MQHQLLKAIEFDSEDHTASQAALWEAANSFKYRSHLYKLLINAASSSPARRTALQTRRTTPGPAAPRSLPAPRSPPPREAPTEPAEAVRAGCRTPGRHKLGTHGQRGTNRPQAPGFAN